MESREQPLFTKVTVPTENISWNDDDRNELRKLSRGMMWPDTGGNTEMRSFLEHLRLRKTVSNIPMGRRRYLILYQIIRDLDSIKYEVPDDFLTLEHYRRVVKQLDWTSSPGYPYLKQGNTTNGQMFGVVNGVPKESIVQSTYMMVMHKIKNRIADPIRVFVKPEPHSLKKIACSRHRTISGVSVLDCLIDAMLFGEMNEKMTLNWHQIPPKIGWTLLYGGWKIVPQINVHAADKTAWDWTVQPWMVDALKYVRIGLCQNPTEQWQELVDWRYSEIFENARFIFSNGIIMKQKFKGFMKSGCYNTISDNSLAQMILHYRICDELNLPVGSLWSMGDDTLQTYQPPDYFEALSKHCILKQVEKRAEFAGMLFRGVVVEPSYTNKHAYKLLHLNEKFREELHLAYSLLYHRSNNKFKEIVKKMGSRIPKELLDHIFDE